MKHLFSLLFVIIASNSFCHEYYFSFAEMEYNDLTRKFEVTITVSTHDLEMVYLKTSNTKIDLQKYNANSKTTELMAAYFSNHFQLKTQNERCILKLIGFESSLNGTTNFYFESDAIDITPSLTLKNDILMDQYPQQQNKITLYRQAKSYTHDFLSDERLKVITLN